MKIILLIIVALFIDFSVSKSDNSISCNSNSCQGCTNDPSCVWCDNHCIEMNSNVQCTTRISDKMNCNNKKNKPSTSGCNYKDRLYNFGDQFMEDCNTCTCEDSGDVTCTSNVCNGCSAVQCDENRHCIMINNRPVCRPTQDLCESKPCGNFKCYINQYGAADCMPNPCSTVRCGFNTICVINPHGTAECVIPTCKYNGKTYNHGQNFLSTDGCNTCYCYNGRVSCTLMACTTDILPTPIKCIYGGKTYHEGDSWRAKDGCNTCSCTSGQAHCTSLICSIGSCQTDTDCGSGSFCLKDSCTATTGTCNTCNKNILCTLEYDPVCGCDGKTYGNRCEALRACTCFNPGPCKEQQDNQPQVGNEQVCLSHEECGDTKKFYCSKESCSDTDNGVCTELPTGCSKQLDQVCGCNGITYDNSCCAARAGVNVESAGPCSGTH